MRPIYSENVERLSNYDEGGFHPVHLGEVYNRHYEVIHKLGHGGFATVWLCLDTRSHQWRALKIIAADYSDEEGSDLRLLSILDLDGKGLSECEENHVALPVDSFWIEGVNGQHLCLILPLLGDSIRTKPIWDPPNSFKQIFRQAGKALQFLHRHGICHGDITPRNILFRLEDTTRISREEMLNLVGKHGVEFVRTRTGEKPSPRYPSYIVGPADLSQLMSTGDISVIDFGECFNVSNPPEIIGIPNAYSAPEVRFQFNPGFSGDVWALACTLMEIRTGSVLFSNTERIGALVACFSAYLGPLPEPYRSIRITQLHEMLEEIGQENDPESLRLKSSAEEQLAEFSDPTVERKDTVRFRMALSKMRKETGYENPFLADMALERGYIEMPTRPDGTPDEYAPPIEKRWELENEEFILLGDLFTKTFKYDPKDRLSLEEFLNHPWFKDTTPAPKEENGPHTQTETPAKTFASNQPTTLTSCKDTNLASLDGCASSDEQRPSDSHRPEVTVTHANSEINAACIEDGSSRTRNEAESIARGRLAFWLGKLKVTLWSLQERILLRPSQLIMRLFQSLDHGFILSSIVCCAIGIAFCVIIASMTFSKPAAQGHIPYFQEELIIPITTRSSTSLIYTA